MDLNTEYNLNVLNSYTTHNYPVISYAGSFSPTSGYLVGDVVFYSGRLYQTVA